MKIELFDMTDKEARAFAESDGVRALDHVESEGYRLFGTSIGDAVKMRHYEDGTCKIEIQVPNELQCVPCGVKYLTEKTDCCPVCKTLSRDIMLRNKTFEEPFRKFEAIYSKMLTRALHVAQPLMLLVSDNFTEEQARHKFLQAKEEFDMLVADLSEFNFIFDNGIIDKIIAMKAEHGSVKTMRLLTNGDTSADAIQMFRS